MRHIIFEHFSLLEKNMAGGFVELIWLDQIFTMEDAIFSIRKTHSSA